MMNFHSIRRRLHGKEYHNFHFGISYHTAFLEICVFLISFLCVFFVVDDLEEFLKGVNKMTGWVKIHRQIMDHWLWKEQPYDKARAFMDLVLNANREDKKKVIGNNVFMIYRGSFFTTSNELAERW